MRNKLPAAIVALVVMSVSAVVSLADTYESPFVAGYERFYRDSEDDAVTAGRLLISELSCGACHKTEEPELSPKRGPDLAGAGQRFRLDWFRRYLANPQAVKPGTTMPDVLHGLSAAKKREAAEAIAAFLSTQEPGYPVLVSTASNPIAEEFWRKGNRERGAELYHQIGCVACHEPDESFPAASPQESDLQKMLMQLEPEEIESLGLTNAVRRVRSVPHGDLKGKYSLQSLAFFLYDPQRTRPDGRMPSLNLKPDEAADIAAYLIGKETTPNDDTEARSSSSLVDSGRRFFSELKCSQCHAVDELQPVPHAKGLRDVHSDAPESCLNKPVTGMPDFLLDRTQVHSIRSALNSLGDGSAHASPVHATMVKMNCYACHQRNQLGGVGPNRRQYFETISRVDIGDEGRLPPPLDGVGRKLKKEALEDALNGTINVRPHMYIRMPKFAADSVSSLPAALIKADAVNQPSAKPFSGEIGKLAGDGRMLFDTGCVQCHPVRGEQLPGVVGIDLAGAGKRLQPQWFHDFLLNPVALKDRTRMPTFFPDGRSVNSEILDGDTERQIAALWAYVIDIEKQPLPQKIIDGKAHDFELVPDKRPIVLRTFMENVGTHAIAVGFGQKVHYVFDAERVRLAQAWRGRFLDAHGTWFDRFTPPAIPLGDEIVDFPPGVALAVLPDRDAPWPTFEETAIRFGGFRVDQSGVPTFLYRIGGFDLQDRLSPNDQGGMDRSITVTPRQQSAGVQGELFLRANAGPSIRRDSARSYTNQIELTVTVAEPLGTKGIVRESNGLQEWLIQVPPDGKSLEVNYQW